MTSRSLAVQLAYIADIADIADIANRQRPNEGAASLACGGGASRAKGVDCRDEQATLKNKSSARALRRPGSKALRRRNTRGISRSRNADPGDASAYAAIDLLKLAP